MATAAQAESVLTSRPFLGGRLGAMLSCRGGAHPLSAVDAAAVARLFRSAGLVLFRGFDVTMDSFKAFSEALCDGFMGYEGGASARPIVNNDPTMMTVLEPSKRFAIPLHGEMYYTKHRPQVLWFYCATPAERDGETTVADGTELYVRLSPSTRALFETHRIKYICTHPDGRWQELYRSGDLEVVRRHCADNETALRVDERDGSLVTEYVSGAVGASAFGTRRVFINNLLPMVQWEAQGFGQRIVRLEDGTSIPEPVVDELRAIAADATVPVPWQAQDVLMVDNTRFLHGRRAFTDPRREIYVRLSRALRPDA
jgi:alpha-ketoglutarate-dependent taurine dioxygenase